MTPEREPGLSPKMQRAITELEGLIRNRYPDASFRVARSPDDGRSIHLLTTVDVEDRDEVMDIVVERVMEFQIEQKLPVHVVPLHTRERAEKILADQRRQRHAAGKVAVGIPARQP